MTPELSQRLGQALGRHPVQPHERATVLSASVDALTWDDLPQWAQALVEDIESRPPGTPGGEDKSRDFAALRSDARTDRDDEIARALAFAVDEVSRRFDPEQPRVRAGERGGEWTATGILRDALKLAHRIGLEPGEEFVGSDKVAGDSGTVRLAATTRNGSSLMLRIGVGDQRFGSRDDDGGPWRGGPGMTNADRGRLQAEFVDLDELIDDSGLGLTAEQQARYDALDAMSLNFGYASGYTARLDEASVERLRSTLTQAVSAAVKADKEDNALYDRLDAAEKRYDEHLDMAFEGKGPNDVMDAPDAETAQRLFDERQALEREAEALDTFRTLADGVERGEWADIHYQVYTDDPSMGPQIILGAVPHNDPEIATLDDLGDSRATLDVAEALRLIRLLTPATPDGTATRARYGEGVGERIPTGHKGGGRFRKLSDRLTDALADWLKGEGPDDPLDEFSREQLRKTAKELADKARAAGDNDRADRLTPRRGASSDEIKLALYKDMRASSRSERDDDTKADEPEAPAKKAAPRKRAPAKAAVPADRPVVGRNISEGFDYPELQATPSRGDRGDWRMHAIQEQQGFNGQPDTVTSEEFDRAVASGEIIQTYRGFNGEAAADFAEAYKSGDHFPGGGVYGAGTYVAVNLEDANLGAGRWYPESTNGEVIRIGIRRDAKMVRLKKLVAEHRKFERDHADELAAEDAALSAVKKRMMAEAAREATTEGRKRVYDSYESALAEAAPMRSVTKDIGRFAALRGYDVIDVRNDDELQPQLVVLNRTATVVERASAAPARQLDDAGIPHRVPQPGMPETPPNALAKAAAAEPGEADPAALSQDELLSLQDLSQAGRFTENGWVKKSDLPAARHERLDSLADKGWIDKQSTADGDFFRISPQSVGGRNATAGGALTGDVLPAQVTPEHRISLTKVNRGAVIHGYRNPDDPSSFENAPEGSPDQSRVVRVLVQRIERVDENGEPTKALLTPYRRVVGHDAETGRRVTSPVVPVGSYWNWEFNPDADTSPDIEGDVVGNVRPTLPAPLAIAPVGFDPSTLEGLTVRQKRTRLKAMGFSPEQVDELAPTLAMQKKARRSQDADPGDLRRAEQNDGDEPVDEWDLALEHLYDEASRAAGTDTTAPGNDELHHYWTRGPGLARWVGSPKPWTTLLALLQEKVPDKPIEVLKKWVSRWYIEVFGYAAGSDKARVAHGKPPRGERVGPG
jgi:hypothetical protein